MYNLIFLVFILVLLTLNNIYDIATEFNFLFIPNLTN